MNDFLSNLKNIFHDIVLFNPSSNDKIDFVSALLSNDSFSHIPSDYYNFLKLSDGIILQNLELYGIEKHNRSDEAYNFPSLIDVNEEFKKNKNPLLLNSLLIGYFALFAIIYDNNLKIYKVVDRRFFTIFFSCKSIYELFNFIIDNLEV